MAGLRPAALFARWLSRRLNRRTPELVFHHDVGLASKGWLFGGC